MESTLEEVASPALSEVDVPRVAAMGLTDTLRQAVLVLGNSDQVHVIRHQAPSEIRDTESLSLLREMLQILQAVLISEEDVHPPNAPLRDVMREIRDDDASDSSHAQILS